MDNAFWTAFEKQAKQRRADFEAGLRQARQEGREEEFVMGWLNQIAAASVAGEGFFGARQ